MNEDRIVVMMKTLAYKNSLDLVLLLDGKRSVQDLTEATGLTQTGVSHLLKTLLMAGLVSAIRDGKKRLYHITCPHYARLIGLVRELLEEN
jgi:DNA-binding transcriptional ArsR family regulator